MKFAGRFQKIFAVWFLGLGLAVSALAPSARAQTPNPNEAGIGSNDPLVPPSEAGDPVYGYVAFGFFAAFALFIVCKSARRG